MSEAEVTYEEEYNGPTRPCEECEDPDLYEVRYEDGAVTIVCMDCYEVKQVSGPGKISEGGKLVDRPNT